MNLPARTFNKPLFSLFAICSLAAVFWIPYFVPQSPSTSESWIFGYYNRAGVLLVLASTLIAVLWTRGINLSLPAPEPPTKLPLKVLFLSLLAYLCAGVGMYLFAGRYGGFGESFYFIDRAWLVEHGKIPYVDFEYCFGISFLYGPIFLERLLHVSLNAAYHLYWLFNLLVGVCLSFAIFNRINFPTRSRLSIYLVLLLPGIFTVLNMGVNYAGPRFLFPLYFVLLMRSFFERDDPASRMRAGVFAVFAVAFMFLFSSETPIALAVTAICLYILFTPKWNRHLSVIFAALLAALAALFWAVSRTQIFETIRTDGAGANSFPIVPSVAVLYYFAILFWGGCYIYRRIAQRKFNRAQGTIKDDCLALILYSLPMAPAALGRCDVGHLASGGLGLILASMFCASNDESAWRSYRTFYIFFMFLLPTLTAFIFVRPLFVRAAQMNSVHTGSYSRGYFDLAATYPNWTGSFFVPWGFRPNGIGTYLSPRIDYGRFDGLQNMNTVSAITETIQHLSSNPQEALLVPANFEDTCQINEAGEKLIISFLLDTVYLRKVAHPTSIRKPICDYIIANYRMTQAPDAQHYNYGLWVRRTAQISDANSAKPPN